MIYFMNIIGAILMVGGIFGLGVWFARFVDQEKEFKMNNVKSKRMKL